MLVSYGGTAIVWHVQEGVRTFSVRVGVKNVFWTCIILLETAYAGALGVGLASQVLPLSLPPFILQSFRSCFNEPAAKRLCSGCSPCCHFGYQLHH